MKLQGELEQKFVSQGFDGLLNVGPGPVVTTSEVGSPVLRL